MPVLRVKRLYVVRKNGDSRLVAAGQLRRMTGRIGMPVETDYQVIRAGNLRTDQRVAEMILETGSGIYSRVKSRSSRTDIRAEQGGDPTARIPKPKNSFNIPL